ncbi:hypothetical protein FB451DRAFT_1399583 [Mycena latifolia]|nr:hypothetical protein FB451DRAFT_1399583 [Mycena latifolia]
MSADDAAILSAAALHAIHTEGQIKGSLVTEDPLRFQKLRQLGALTLRSHLDLTLFLALDMYDLCTPAVIESLVHTIENGLEQLTRKDEHPEGVFVAFIGGLVENCGTDATLFDAWISQCLGSILTARHPLPPMATSPNQVATASLVEQVQKAVLWEMGSTRFEESGYVLPTVSHNLWGVDGATSPAKVVLYRRLGESTFRRLIATVLSSPSMALTPEENIILSAVLFSPATCAKILAVNGHNCERTMRACPLHGSNTDPEDVFAAFLIYLGRYLASSPHSFVRFKPWFDRIFPSLAKVAVKSVRAGSAQAKKRTNNGTAAKVPVKKVKTAKAETVEIQKSILTDHTNILPPVPNSVPYSGLSSGGSVSLSPASCALRRKLRAEKLRAARAARLQSAPSTITLTGQSLMVNPNKKRTPDGFGVPFNYPPDLQRSKAPPRKFRRTPVGSHPMHPWSPLHPLRPM